MVPLFTAAIFVSSALLFLVQPMAAKAILPRFGGVPAVWTASMVFFQGALLAGYLYAHAAVGRLGVRRHAWVHLAVLAAPLAALPLVFPGGWEPRAGVSPVPALLGLLTVSVGLPFIVVAASGPLVQRWFAATGHPGGTDPYFLFAASNLGSLGGLLAYPLLVERHLTLAGQRALWSAGYVLYAFLAAACAVTAARAKGESVVAEPVVAEPVVAEPVEADPVEADPVEADPVGNKPVAAGAPAWRERLRWMALAFVPSSLTLGVTVHFTSDIAPIPLLWVVPLSVYLLSFVLTFGRRPLPHRAVVMAFPIPVVALGVVLALRLDTPLWLVGGIHLTALLAVGLLCHGELAHTRPGPERLTGFYLLVSLGGVAGGLANALVAPRVFDTVAEYPLVLVLACLLRRSRVSGDVRALFSRALDIALPAAIGLALWVALRPIPPGERTTSRIVVLGIAGAAVVAVAARPVRLALGMASLLLIGALPGGVTGQELFRERTFFGTHSVVAKNGFHFFVHGTTIHGIQRWDPEGETEALSYYARSGPVGDVFTTRPRPPQRVAVLGLGTGALSCYAEPGAAWTFFEIDPVVERIARDPRLFRYLSACAPQARVVLGDGRLSIAREPAASFDLIALDAFNSDSVPVHLMTREATRLYLSRLAPGRILLFNVTNRYLDLAPVLADIARVEGLYARRRQEIFEDADAGILVSHWVVMARDAASLGAIERRPGWSTVFGDGSRLWTDDFSNVLGLFEWR